VKKEDVPGFQCRGIARLEDHNTRIIVFGRDAEQARAVAEAIAREAFHNVSFFSGSYAELVTIERSRADSRH
jgi:superfamily II DNA or RNA helicase